MWRQIRRARGLAALRRLGDPPSRPRPLRGDPGQHRQGRGCQRHDLRRITQTGDESLAIPPESPEVRLAQGTDGRAAVVGLDGEPARARDRRGLPGPARAALRGWDAPGPAGADRDAYVGSGVMASAVGMDKDVTKRLPASPASRSRPTAPSPAAPGPRRRLLDDIAATLTLPVFVKPATWAPASASRRSRTGPTSRRRSAMPSSTT